MNTYQQALVWLSGGGYVYQSTPDMLTDQCVAYDSNNNRLTLYTGTSGVQAFTPTSEQEAATNWNFSPQHTDRPPRTS